MTDIFLSYTEKDRDIVRRVAAALESVGWTVWWDRRIPAGKTWRSVLEQALEDMSCMVVLWSAHSIESEWVYEEATEGRRLGKLFPVLIEPVRPPAGFREIQAADLTGWDGSLEFEGMRLLVADLESLLGKPANGAANLRAGADATDSDASPGEHDRAYDPADIDSAPTRTPAFARGRLKMWAVAGGLLLAGAATYLGLSSQEHAGYSPPVSESIRRDTPRTAPAVEVAPAPAPPVTAEVPRESGPPGISPEAALAPAATSRAPARQASKQPETIRATSSRCADLLARVQLGETLPEEAQIIFRKECTQ